MLINLSLCPTTLSNTLFLAHTHTTHSSKKYRFVTMGAFALKGFRLGSCLGVSLLLLYVAVLTGALLRDLQIVSLGESCLE